LGDFHQGRGIRNGQKKHEKRKFGARKKMNRSLESKLRDAVRFLDDGIKEKPKTKHSPRKSSMEQSLMAAKKAFKNR